MAGKAQRPDAAAVAAGGRSEFGCSNAEVPADDAAKAESMILAAGGPAEATVKVK